MPSHEEHCQDSLKKYGKRFDELHSWMDELSTLLIGGHRIYRHDPVATPPIAKEMFGELADQACLDHIRMDKEEKRKKKSEGTISTAPKLYWWKNHPYIKRSMEKEVDQYCGDEFLYKLIETCDEKNRSENIAYHARRAYFKGQRESSDRRFLD